MLTKIFKFVGLIVLLTFLPLIPLGSYISLGIIGVALWRMID